MLFVRIGRHSDLLANGPGFCSPLGSFVIVDPQSGYQRFNLAYSKEQACACQEAKLPEKQRSRWSLRLVKKPTDFPVEFREKRGLWGRGGSVCRNGWRRGGVR
jgi:hypothetical protein